MKLLFSQHFFQGELAGIDGQHFFDLRKPILQQLFCPQTEGKFTASVEAPADELQCDPAMFLIGLQ
jgi:hypothetical protein